MKKIILGIVILVLLGLGGGGYWYFKVYQPRQAAKEFVLIYRDFQINIQNAATDQPDEASFKKGSILVVENTRSKLNELKPTEQIILVRKDFIAFLDATKLFLTLFRFGPVNQTISDADKNKTRLGNVLDNKIQELIVTYPELKSL
ncbi:MAG: hypothetical protein Q8Q89_03220 [bacterium]|nr:hypothetical protein [bacterium]